MALDGIYLRFLKNEIEEKALGAKVDKIYQPAHDEIVFSLRGKSGNHKLLINCGGALQRVALTDEKVENPLSPPMFCMLLRKHLQGGTLISVRQEGMDRSLYFDFSVINELGDRQTETIVAVLTGRSGNIILIREDGRIIDSVRRTDLAAENGITILPGAVYMPLEKRNKCDVSVLSADEVTERVFSSRDSASGVIMREIEGISPQSAAVLAERVFSDSDAGIENGYRERFKEEIEKLQKRLSGEAGEFFINFDNENKPRLFGFLAPNADGNKFFNSPSETIEIFYRGKASAERASAYTAALIKLVNTRKERIKRKLWAQREDLKKSAGREKYRIMGELITANLYRIEKGASSAQVEDYYEDPPVMRKIPLDKRLTPSQNAQKYYKEYNKLANAEKVLYDLIAEGEAEEEYLESVLDALKRTESENDARLIREELVREGYIKENRKDKRKVIEGEFKKATTSDGFTVLIGRNNIQNDKLTMRTAENNDMWLHTQKIAGSHVIIKSDGREITDKAIFEAAVLAAANSKGNEAGKVPVDYTLKRYVKKPSGAKPGKVIYTNYKTIYVSPKGIN